MASIEALKETVHKALLPAHYEREHTHELVTRYLLISEQLRDLGVSLSTFGHTEHGVTKIEINLTFTKAHEQQILELLHEAQIPEIIDPSTKMYETLSLISAARFDQNDPLVKQITDIRHYTIYRGQHIADADLQILSPHVT